jgi:hypothetical protein
MTIFFAILTHGKIKRLLNWADWFSSSGNYLKSMFSFSFEFLGFHFSNFSDFYFRIHSSIFNRIISKKIPTKIRKKILMFLPSSFLSNSFSIFHIIYRIPYDSSGQIPRRNKILTVAPSQVNHTRRFSYHHNNSFYSLLNYFQTWQ